MAQPVYADHPLEAYLRQSGEGETMPGITPDLIADDDEPVIFVEDDEDVLSVLPPSVRGVLQAAYTLLTAHSVSGRRRAFAERFKYDVISSTLLSSTIAASSFIHTRRPLSPNLPGHLRTNSIDAHVPPPPIPTQLTHPLTPTHSLTEQQLQYWGLALTFLASVCAALGLWFCAAILAVVGIYPYLPTSPSPAQDNSIQLALDGLHDLVSAGQTWDASVQEAIEILESEERNSFYSPSSPSSVLRVALNSSLQTTRTQCEKVRQLFAALTTPEELTQLNEMYAPPSPSMSTFGLSNSGYDHLGPSPLLHSIHNRKRTLSTPTRPADKRSTWSGAYTSLPPLAGGGSISQQARLRREQRRVDLIQAGWSSTASAPVSPDGHSLLGVREEGNDADERPFPTEYFGAQALELRKRRKRGGMEALGLGHSPPRATHGLGLSGAPTLSSGSRLTSMPSTRHPLSLSSLNHALSGAIAAKRHACAHLLALHFDVGEEDGDYWEDVQSVMALLSSTFADASARLGDALEELARQRFKDETPTESSHSRHASGVSFIAGVYNDTEGGHDSAAEDGADGLGQRTITRKKGRTMAQMVSGFAPMPSDVARFAAHVDAISAALDEAREHLEATVSALRNPASPLDQTADSTSTLGYTPTRADRRRTEAPALQAYERLRRELGYALRECERGRERLLDIIATQHPTSRGDESEGEGEDGVPALERDAGSEGSSGERPASLEFHHLHSMPVSVPAGPREVVGEEREGTQEVDDVSAHLLLGTGAEHLPRPGKETVYEAASGTVGPFARERSKLTREERIALAKARRESGASEHHLSQITFPPEEGVERELSGPGMDVVQELKDVIWKVGERRRKMAEGADEGTPTEAPATPTLETQNPGFMSNVL